MKTTLTLTLTAISVILVCRNWSQSAPLQSPSVPAAGLISFRIVFGALQERGLDYSGSISLSAGKIVRLFPDYRREEMAYHASTCIYPIMHVIAMRRAVFERYPWVATNLLKAFDEAKARSVERINDLTASRIPVPWSAAIAG